MLAKCNAFAELGLWPRKANLDPESWLGNFTPGEMEHALYLLDAFTHYSRDLLTEVFAAGVQNLSSLIALPGRDFRSRREAWGAFLDRVVLTYVTGEDPSPTDSGQEFARLARKDLEIPEQQIVEPERAMHLLASDPTIPVLFVDDFVGSGNQFVETLDRRHAGYSFADVLEREPEATVFYCPALCTAFGSDAIGAEFPRVRISPGHIIPREYSALHRDSVVWPAHLRESGPAFVEEASRRAGIPDDDGPDDWRGFARLGLTLSLVDQPPDATLPLMYWEGGGWHPLARRS